MNRHVDKCRNIVGHHPWCALKNSPTICSSDLALFCNIFQLASLCGDKHNSFFFLNWQAQFLDFHLFRKIKPLQFTHLLIKPLQFYNCKLCTVKWTNLAITINRERFLIIALSGRYKFHRFVLTWDYHQTSCLRKWKCPETNLHSISFDVQEQGLDMR